MSGGGRLVVVENAVVVCFHYSFYSFRRKYLKRMFLNDSFTFAKKVKQANNLFKANFYSNTKMLLLLLFFAQTSRGAFTV